MKEFGENPKLDRSDCELFPMDDSYPGCERACASLLIYPPNRIRVEEITALLDVQPTLAYNKGAKGVKRFSKEWVARRNVWYLESEEQVKSLDLRHHLNWLLQRLDGAEKQILSLQRELGLEMFVKAIFWQTSGATGGFPVLSPSQMSGLVKLNLDLFIEIQNYSDGN